MPSFFEILKVHIYLCWFAQRNLHHSHTAKKAHLACYRASLVPNHQRIKNNIDIYRKIAPITRTDGVSHTGELHHFDQKSLFALSFGAQCNM